MPAYEISNHAAKDAQSRHNLIYWRYGDYAGIGPGAHGRLTIDGQKIATTTPLMPEEWLNQVEKNGSATEDAEIINGADQAIEYLMMSLRLAEGTSLRRYETLSGLSIDSQALQNQQELGFIVVENDRIKATKKGRPILNSVLRELLV